MAGVVTPTRTRARAGLLVAASVLPLLLGPGTGGPAAVAEGRPISGPERAARPAGTPTGARRPDRLVPLADLVPGRPLPPGAADTPDQALAPWPGPATGPDDPAAPTAAQARAAERTEYVPADDAAGVGAADRERMLRPARGFCSRHTGPYQAQVERFLGRRVRPGVPVVQTPAGCAAIRRY